MDIVPRPGLLPSKDGRTYLVPKEVRAVNIIEDPKTKVEFYPNGRF